MSDQDLKKSETSQVDDTIVSIPLDERGAVVLNIRLGSKYVEDVAYTLSDLQNNRLSKGILLWLEKYGVTHGRTMDVQAIFNTLTDIYLTTQPIISPLEVFRRHEKGE